MSALVAAPRELVEAVAAFHLPATADRRLRVLMDRNNDGALTGEERDELQALADLSEELSLVRADALHLLGRATIALLDMNHARRILIRSAEQRFGLFPPSA